MREAQQSQAASDFVGREAEMRLLLAAMEGARAGRGCLFLIGGEPGIGKSRLADEFVRHAREEGLRVLWARCWEGAGAPAYWPWIQALRAHLRSVEPEVVRRQLGTGAPDVAQMLPEIRALLPELPPSPPESDSARFQLFDSTATFLRNVAADRPTLLVLDDLHAGDTPSILLLRFLASQLADMHLLIIGTYRDVALTPDHALTGALGEMAREPVTQLFVLQGLSENVAGRFIELAVGSAPSARLARGMWRETSGNPLFLKEATRLLLSEGGLEDAVIAGTLHLAVPAGVREVIARRVGQLSGRSVEALSYAAALGPEFSAEVLRRVGGYAQGELSPVLDEASREGLLAPVPGSPGRLRFSHDLVRESVYQEHSDAQRAALHRRIAETLENLYGPKDEAQLAELAHHFFEAAQATDTEGRVEIAARAQDYATAAGQLAVRSLAYEEAARLMRIALAMLDLQTSAEEEARTELLLSIGDAEARAGEMESANKAFQAAAEIARRTGQATHLARAALGIGGRLPWGRPGNNPSLLPLLQEALMMLGGEDDRMRVKLLARLACAWRSSPEKRQQSDTLSRQAIELARRLDDQAALRYALAARYWATWWPENPEERAQLAAEMIAVSEELGDPERLVDARLMLWLSHSELGHMREGNRELEHVRRVAAELRQPAQLWLGVATRALIALMKGDYQLSEELIGEEMMPRPPTTPALDNVSAARFHLFLLCRDKGRPADAESEVRAAAEEFSWYPLHRAALVLLLLDMNRVDEARGWFDSLAQGDFEALYRDNEWLLGTSLAAEACWRLGDSDAAAILYEQLRPFAGRHAIGHAEGSVGVVDRYIGLLAQVLGRLDDAERHLLAAVELNERMGARPWAAHSQRDLAQVLSQRNHPGDAGRAAHLLDTALATARELGMTNLERKIGDLTPSLPAAGVGPAGPASVPATFRREGEYWTIAYGPDSFRLRDSKGLQYLARLLAEPGSETLALTLAQEQVPSSARPGRDDELRPTDLGAAGPQLDEHAKQEYRARIHELQGELDEAEEWHDPERAERAREEMDFIAREISGSVGLGGRDRPTGSASERARLSVTRAIRLAMARIAEHSKTLADHLETTVHTGTYCAYRPDPRLPIEWQL
jgi:tetratricopeptide (TPR) repeat protein